VIRYRLRATLALGETRPSTMSRLLERCDDLCARLSTSSLDCTSSAARRLVASQARQQARARCGVQPLGDVLQHPSPKL